MDPETQEAQARAVARARAEAKQKVVERLALISAAIWAVGALLAYLFVLVPIGSRPVGGMIAGVLLLVPAALPWLFYRRMLAAAEARAVRQAAPRSGS
jgi:hypothetical protein